MDLGRGLKRRILTLSRGLRRGRREANGVLMTHLLRLSDGDSTRVRAGACLNPLLHDARFTARLNARLNACVSGRVNADSGVNSCLSAACLGVEWRVGRCLSARPGAGRTASPGRGARLCVDLSTTHHRCLFSGPVASHLGSLASSQRPFISVPPFLSAPHPHPSSPAPARARLLPTLALALVLALAHHSFLAAC